MASELCFTFEPAKMPSASRGEEADAPGSLPPTTDEPSQALAGPDSLDSPPRALERPAGQLPSPTLLPTPPPKAGCKASKNVTGRSARIPPPSHASVPSASLEGLLLRAGSHPLLLGSRLWAGLGEQSWRQEGWLLLAMSCGCQEQTPGLPQEDEVVYWQESKVSSRT